MYVVFVGGVVRCLWCLLVVCSVVCGRINIFDKDIKFCVGFILLCTIKIEVHFMILNLSWQCYSIKFVYCIYIEWINFEYKNMWLYGKFPCMILTHGTHIDSECDLLVL